MNAIQEILFQAASAWQHSVVDQFCEKRRHVT